MAGNRRLTLAVTLVALVAVVALTAMVASVIVVVTALSHSTPPRHLAKRTRPVPESWSLMWYNLSAGDCLNGPDLGLGTDMPFPGTVTAVPCTQPHRAEIYFAGSLWPASAKYPGDGAASDRADAQCHTAFAAYVGIDISQSALSYHYWYPAGGIDWGSGDRQVVCVAYDPHVPLSTSVKGTQA